MIEVIITGVVGIVTTIISSIVSWMSAKKKYYAEVNHAEIENMKESLEFYKTLSESNQATLTEILDKSKELAENNLKLIIEIQNLKVQVGILLNIINAEVADIDFDKYGIKVENGVVSRKKVQER